MNISLSKRLCLTAMLTLGAIVYTASAPAQTNKLVIEIRRQRAKPPASSHGKRTVG